MADMNSTKPDFSTDLPHRAYIFPSKKKRGPNCANHSNTKNCGQNKLTYDDITVNTIAMDCVQLPPSILLHTGLVDSSANAMICAPAPPDGSTGIRLDAAGSVQSLLSNFDMDRASTTPFSVLALVAFASAFWYRHKYQRAIDGRERTT